MSQLALVKQYWWNNTLSKKNATLLSIFFLGSTFCRITVTSFDIGFTFSMPSQIDTIQPTTITAEMCNVQQCTQLTQRILKKQGTTRMNWLQKTRPKGNEIARNYRFAMLIDWIVVCLERISRLRTMTKSTEQKKTIFNHKTLAGRIKRLGEQFLFTLVSCTYSSACGLIFSPYLNKLIELCAFSNISSIFHFLFIHIHQVNRIFSISRTFMTWIQII